MNTMKENIAIGVGLVMIFMAGAGVGYGIGVSRSEDTITKVATDKGGAESDARAASATLDEIRSRLNTQGVELDAMRKVAAAALHERDALQAEKAKRARQDETNLRNKAHEAPDCTSLARLPVCPVVAGGLWGDAQGDSTTGGSR